MLLSAAVVSVLVLAGLLVAIMPGRPDHHSVTLTWHAPTLTKGLAVAGYNVYRSVQSGGPYVRIASLVKDLRYKDLLVGNERTYYYVVTSVDASGRESRYSREIEAKVP